MAEVSLFHGPQPAVAASMDFSMEPQPAVMIQKTNVDAQPAVAAQMRNKKRPEPAAVALTLGEFMKHMDADSPDLKEWAETNYSTMKNRVYAKGKTIEAGSLNWMVLANTDEKTAGWVASWVYFRTESGLTMPHCCFGKRAPWMKLQKEGRHLLLSRFLAAEEGRVTSEIAEFITSRVRARGHDELSQMPQ